jgi:hypothetical protein
LEPRLDSIGLLCKPALKQPITDQYVSDGVANQKRDEKPYATPPEKQGVREPRAAPAAHQDYPDSAASPAHPSNRLVAQLNESWRVIDDPLQWILQRRKGNPRKKNSGWRSRSFCRTREALLCCIREYCCSPDQGQSRCIREYHGVDDAALQQICALPDWHPDWDRRNNPTNLDVRGTDQAHANGQSKPLVSQALEDCEAGDQPPRNSQPALS